MNFHSLTSNLDDNELANNNNEPNTAEHRVGENTFENVDFVIDLSGSKHVENLEEYEDIEVNGQVS